MIAGSTFSLNAKLPLSTTVRPRIDELTKNDPIDLPLGPMTWARAKRLNEPLMGLI